MERSTIQYLVKRGVSQRQIAKELGRSRATIARVLRDPVDRRPSPLGEHRGDGEYSGGG